MPKKNPLNLTKDSRGNWRRQNLGWVARGGEIKPMTFRLGKDFNEACRRVALLDQVWTFLEKSWAEEPAEERKEKPCWSGYFLAIGRALARGEQEVALEPLPGVLPEALSVAVRVLQQQFPFIKLRLAGVDEGEVGETLRGWRDELLEEEEAKQREYRNIRYGRERFERVVLSEVPTPVGETFHGALRAYERHVKDRHKAPGGMLSEFGALVTRRVANFSDHHKDFPLDSLTLGKLDEIETYWASRPQTKQGKPCSVSWAEGMLKQFRDFLRWLHRSDLGWKKPADYEALPRRIRREYAEISNRGVEKFTKRELERLYEYALPTERVFLLLGMNCAFNAREIGTLRLDEIREGERTFIHRIRTKTGVQTRFYLWPETAEGIRWYLTHKRPESDKPYVFLTETGHELFKPTKGNHRNQYVPRMWERLLARVRKDYPDFLQLSFGKLRKTSANWVRGKYGKEVADLHLGHGRREVVDHYTDKPYRTLFEAQVRLRKALRSMFELVGDPFPAGVKKDNTSKSLAERKRYQEMREEGKTLKEIAEECGVCIDTVRRHTEKPKKGESEGPDGGNGLPGDKGG